MHATFTLNSFINAGKYLSLSNHIRYHVYGASGYGITIKITIN